RESPGHPPRTTDRARPGRHPAGRHTLCPGVSPTERARSRSMPRPDRTAAGGDRAAKVAKIHKAGAAAERRRSSMIWGAAALVLTLIVGSVVAAVVLDSP